MRYRDGARGERFSAVDRIGLGPCSGHVLACRVAFATMT